MTTDHAAAARKITLTLFTAQAFGSAGFIAAATIASLVGAGLAGTELWAGLPSAAFLLGSALAAYGWSLAMDAFGRRLGLGFGLLVGVAGAGLASAAVVFASLPGLLLGLLLMGSAQAALLLGRFAAAEVHAPALRGRAVANVVLGGTAGAVFGPLMVGPVGALAEGLGLPELAGPYLASAVMFALAAAVVLALLRPEPKELAKELAQELAQAHPEVSQGPGPGRPLARILRDPGVVTAIAAMVCGQTVMVGLMVITALHMSHHHHPLTSISAVIASHTFGMYAFALVSGRLTDLWGRGPVIMSGALLLGLASGMATLSPQVLPLAVALFGLGLGWNLLFVGGSALLSDRLAPAERGRVQGVGDVLIGLASALASLGSGAVLAFAGYEVLGLVGAVLALLPLGLSLWWLWARPAQERPKKRPERLAD